MELMAQEDIEAPADRVFAALSDFAEIERQAMRRGIEIRRDTGATEPGETVPGAGTVWIAGFRFRGKPREARIALTEIAAPEEMVFLATSGGLETRTRVAVVALSRNRSRIHFASELMPKTLSARLLVQSLKLARGGIEKRFSRRVAGFAEQLEARLKSAI